MWDTYLHKHPKFTVDHSNGDVAADSYHKYKQDIVLINSIKVGLFAHPIYSEEGDYPSLVRKRIDDMSRNQGFARSRLPSFTPEEVAMVRGSSDFFGINHYTTYLMSNSSMEPGWTVPSVDHDTGVKIEQSKEWPIPGAEWLSWL
ncbi:unnamed protein product [Danaus chrysippus]|uniref:(African queen) hypothetical protein n=1 Tax=Danaus chrysippus TaxID=151541 RepID=A0A8J2QCI6_9NEOP|nr:unnamed protein product [Danaus chrysippus]